MKNLSIFVGDLESLLLDRADDDGDRRSCLRNERRSGASHLEGCMSAMMHAHERSLSGRGVWCLTFCLGWFSWSSNYYSGGALPVLCELLGCFGSLDHTPVNA